MLGRWGGPLPQTWLDQQLLLQKKILKRMRELGMTPGMMFCFFATHSLPLPLFLSYSVCHPILFVLSINHIATFHYHLSLLLEVKVGHQAKKHRNWIVNVSLRLKEELD